MTTHPDMHKKPAVLILGAPGSGKGTQGRILGNIPRFFHCACGDVFRSLDTRTALGRQFVAHSSRGELVPDELTIELWKAQLDNMSAAHLYKPDIDFLILDGIPRNVRQAEIMERHVDVHQVFHLSCPDRNELARRMRKRALKENRIDDANDLVIDQRIATYEAETKPILEFYPAQRVSTIDASQPPIQVIAEIIHIITSLPSYTMMAKEIT
jgi:adenylate kinase